MRVILIAVGRMKRGPEAELVDHYARRVRQSGKPVGIGSLDIIEIPESRARDVATRKTEEATAISAKVPDGAHLLCLDERAKPQTSQQFAASLEAQCHGGTATLAMVIGGADGLAPELLDRADGNIGFGRYTLPHQLVRILALEQLYRAITINSGHPYHRP